MLWPHLIRKHWQHTPKHPWQMLPWALTPQKQFTEAPRYPVTLPSFPPSSALLCNTACKAQLQMHHITPLSIHWEVFLKGVKKGQKWIQQFNTLRLKQNSELYEESREGVISPALQVNNQINWFAKVKELRGEVQSFHKSFRIPQAMLFPPCINE